MDDLLAQLARALLYQGNGEVSDLPEEAAARIRALEAEAKLVKDGSYYQSAVFHAAASEAKDALIRELVGALDEARHCAELTATGRSSFLGKIMRTADVALARAKEAGYE